MGDEFWADLHIHTVLSPCAEVEMIPPLIVKRARELGLDLIAITDHNASANAGAVMAAAAGTGLAVWPGMELQTREEVHLLCLFDNLDSSKRWQAAVAEVLPPLQNREEFFGPQFVVDAEGDWMRNETQLLATSAEIGLEEAVSRVHDLGGLAIPAHVDRPSFSLLFNLGFIPPGAALDALEVSPRFLPPDGGGKWPFLRGWPLLVNGDAHRLEDVRRQTCFRAKGPFLQEVELAFKGRGGRSVWVDWKHSQK
jgi:PHP family Zn ribbon phosphoesterase